MFRQQRNDFFPIFRLFFSKGIVGRFKHDYDSFIFRRFRGDMREYTKFVRGGNLKTKQETFMAQTTEVSVFIIEKILRR